MPMNAFVCVVNETAKDRPLAQNRLEELSRLCLTADMSVCGTSVINLREYNSATFIGSGQAQRLKTLAQEAEADLVVFNNSLNPRIQRNLESMMDMCVVDRQEIILQIFANRASTTEARLQVELAQLQYSLPRLTRKWADLSQQRGGVKGSKGSGEKKLELDRRTARERIDRLKNEIARIGRQRQVQRNARMNDDIPKIAIVGYTNSGKSTLLNRISDASVLSEDKLFATLDTTTRRVCLPDGSKALFTDTVGFVSDLPHELVDAFRSTLEEASYADILLIVVDASSPSFATCWNTTREVLESLDAWNKMRVIAVNKIDIATEEQLAQVRGALFSEPYKVEISVTRGTNITQLLDLLADIH